MAPRMVINPHYDLEKLFNKKTLMVDILYTMKDNLVNNTLPKKIQLVGIANNVLLGVFNIEKVNGVYNCFRIVLNNDKLVVSDIGYPITNMGGEFAVDCIMDYIITRDCIKYL